MASPQQLSLGGPPPTTTTTTTPPPAAPTTSRLGAGNGGSYYPAPASGATTTLDTPNVEMGGAIGDNRIATKGKGEVVNMIYENLFGRAPDQAGLDYWSEADMNGLELQAAIRQGGIESGEISASSGVSGGVNGGYQNYSLEQLTDMVNGMAMSNADIAQALGPMPGGATAATVNANALATALRADYEDAQRKAQEYLDQAIQGSQDRTDAMDAQARQEIENQRRWQETEIEKWRSGVAQVDPSGIGSLSPIDALNKLLDADSEYLQRAQTVAEQGFAARGLNNSSMAVQAGVEGAIERATPLAISDAELANMRWQSYEENRAVLANTHINAGANQFSQRMQFAFDSLLDVNRSALSGAIDQGNYGMQAGIAAGQLRGQAEMQNAQLKTQVSIVNAQMRLQNYLQDKSFMQQSSLLDRQGGWQQVKSYMDHQYAKDLSHVNFLQEIGVIDAQYAANLSLQGNELLMRKYVADLSSATQRAIAQGQIESTEILTREGFANDRTLARINLESNLILQDEAFNNSLLLEEVRFDNSLTAEEFASDLAIQRLNITQDFQASQLDTEITATMDRLLVDIENRSSLTFAQIDAQDRSSVSSIVTNMVSSYSSSASALLSNPEYVDNPGAMDTALNTLFTTLVTPTLDMVSTIYGVDLAEEIDLG